VIVSLTFAAGLKAGLSAEDRDELLGQLQLVVDQLEVDLIEVIDDRRVEMSPGQKPRDLGAADEASRSALNAARGSAPYSLFPGYFDDTSVLIPGDHSDYALIDLPGQPMHGLGVVTLGEALREVQADDGADDDERRLAERLRAIFERCQEQRFVFMLHTF
jgi:hypothetical protein